MPALTRPGLRYPGIPPTIDPATGTIIGGQPPQDAYYDSPEEALSAGNEALARASAANPLMFDPETMIGPEATADPTTGLIAGDPQSLPMTGGPQPGTLPMLRKRSIQEATTDQFGNTTPLVPGETTKLGKLVAFLGAAARGSMDAIASGALNAERGKSSFGAGVEGAVTMPFLRAQRAQAIQHSQLENELVRQQTYALPMLRASRLARERAQTNWYNQRANAADFKTIPGVGLMKISANGTPLGIVPGSEAPEKDTPAARMQLVKEHPELFSDAGDQNEYIRYGTKQPKFQNANEWQTRMDAANGDPAAKRALQQRQAEDERLARIHREPIERPDESGLTAGEGRLLNADPAYSTAKRNVNALITERAKAAAWAGPEELNSYDSQIAAQQAVMDDRMSRLVRGRVPAQQPQLALPAPVASHGGGYSEAAPAAAPAAPRIGLGSTIINRGTGERRRWNGSQWVRIARPR